MKKGIFILLILILFLSGCWDKRELNELAITVGIGLDKIDDEYLVTAQVAVPSELSSKGGAGHSQITIYQGKGTTVYEAIRQLTKSSPRIIYLGHLQMLIIGESLAREGIGDSLDFLARNWEVRWDFYVAVSKDSTAEKILNVQTPLESVPATDMHFTLLNSDKTYANTTGVTLIDLLTDLEKTGKQPVLTGVYILGDSKSGSNKSNVESIMPSAQIEFDGLAVFKRDKLVGWLSEDDTKSYNSVINHIKRSVSTISCPKKGKANIEVYRFDSKMKGKMNKGKPEIDIHIQVDGDIGAIECEMDLTKEESLHALEKIYKKEEKDSIEKTIKKVQKEIGVDIFGFGAAIYHDDHKAWEKVKDQWDEEFLDVKVNIKVDVELKLIGAINNSFKEKIKD
ncbi:Ger(x)C family spore germination protein [Psychrobacillus glaciei]|uniref:Ger(X)C family spore germination protein n=1 Tax=Psychrobacillus glaciei TaxID=2283160 RepID=A0A5J6SMP5_9BACI|nr:Ger(x)C family spore germination protein [Psychrobacillus glaciei]QFF99059.1 Ger(x)C family spore germination protein [Psychrobacillus glaciei]